MKEFYNLKSEDKFGFQGSILVGNVSKVPQGTAFLDIHRIVGEDEDLEDETWSILDDFQKY